MGSIAHLIDDPSTQPGPSSQKSAKSDPPLKSSATEPVPEHEMEQHRKNYASGSHYDEAYASQNPAENTSEETDSTATMNSNHNANEGRSSRESSGAAAANLLNDEYRKMMNDIQQIQKLRGIGIESKDLPLPKICVVGGQSAGKSSVIEAMSGIQVPRKEGCCTRCPLEINLQQSESNAEWSCKVSLVMRYTFHPGSQQGDLGPWLENSQEEPHFFCTVTNRHDVTNTLTWAQYATLNPGINHKRFVPVPGQTNEPPDDSEVEFSPNIVRLDISAPDLENLSFYDLPGVITNAPDGKEYLVRVVENLVRQHIEDQTCIILLTHSMTEDLANCVAMTLVRGVPGALDRTRCVFTKADRVPKNGVEKWFNQLQDGRYRVGLGYSVVMNDPDLDHRAARVKEIHFFDNEHPWSRLDQYKSWFGTAKLQSSLSHLLYNQICAYLPQIIQKIDTVIHEIDKELGQLPEPPSSDELVWILRKMFNFEAEIRKHFDGGSHEHTFQRNYRIKAQNFQQRLVQSRPIVSPLSKSESDKLNKQRAHAAALAAQHGKPQSSVIDLDADIGPVTPGPRRRPYAATLSSSPVPHSSPTHEGPRKKAKTNTSGTSGPPGKTFTLDEIREINRDAQGAGIPVSCSEISIERMNQRSVNHWESLMEGFLTEIERHLKRMVQDEFGRVFANYRQAPLYAEGQEIIRDYLDTAVTEQRTYAARAFNIEKRRPFTVNDAEYQQGKRNALTNLQDARLQRRRELQLEIDELASGRPRSSGEERARAIKKIGPAELGPDEFASDIETMAYVRAYYDIAASRFADNICQAFQAELFWNCREELYEKLLTKLGIVGEHSQGNCRRLLALKPEIEEHRTELLSKKKRFETARATIADRGIPARGKNHAMVEDDMEVDGDMGE